MDGHATFPLPHRQASVGEIQSMFPQADREVIVQLLRDNKGQVNDVIDIFLQDSARMLHSLIDLDHDGCEPFSPRLMLETLLLGRQCRGHLRRRVHIAC